MPKKTKPELSLESLAQSIKQIHSNLDKIRKESLSNKRGSESKINSLQKKLLKIENEPAVSVMYKENGNWEEWTGIFKLSGSDKLEILLKKVEDHFNEHFSDEHYKRLEFGLFQTMNGEKKLYKRLLVKEKES